MLFDLLPKWMYDVIDQSRPEELNETDTDTSCLVIGLVIKGVLQRYEIAFP